MHRGQGGGKHQSKRRVHRHPPEFRLKAVMLHIKGGHSRAVVAREPGISYQRVKDWVAAFHMALRGRPNAPFYMVGRMYGQSVVLTLQYRDHRRIPRRARHPARQQPHPPTRLQRPSETASPCKRAFLAALDPTQPVPESHRLVPLLLSVVHIHSARPRRSLRGRSLAQAYFATNARWSKIRLHEILHWTSARSESTLQSKWKRPDHHSRNTAWRRAVVSWLRCQHLITVSPKPQLSPIFADQVKS